jgi:hypothetical protein
MKVIKSLAKIESKLEAELENSEDFVDRLLMIYGVIGIAHAHSKVALKFLSETNIKIPDKVLEKLKTVAEFVFEQ